MFQNVCPSKEHHPGETTKQVKVLAVHVCKPEFKYSDPCTKWGIVKCVPVTTLGRGGRCRQEEYLGFMTVSQLQAQGEALTQGKGAESDS